MHWIKCKNPSVWLWEGVPPTLDSTNNTHEKSICRCLPNQRYFCRHFYPGYVSQAYIRLIFCSKPATALADPYPSPTIVPKFTARDDCADYESELAVILSKPAKNVSAADAMDYILGYAAANDVSSRKSQLSQSQWCFSKGFDGACPVGPVLVSPKLIPDPSKLHIRGYRNGEVVQDCGIE
jgi:2-keto-4-pentenoate hydratase/2-oxohepta-3-ene-1,7-dioic acid hydratase in catechol pathway